MLSTQTIGITISRVSKKYTKLEQQIFWLQIVLPLFNRKLSAKF